MAYRKEDGLNEKISGFHFSYLKSFSEHIEFQGHEEK